MKKSSILTKIMLALVLCALVFSLAACGLFGGGNEEEPDDGSGKDDPIIEGPTFAEQVVEIVNGVNPLLAAINDVEADGTLGAALSLGVDYSIGGTEGAHELAIKANANATEPEAQISYKMNNTEYLNLTYQDAIVYLVQPVTTINTGRTGADGTKSDVKALEPAVLDLMFVAMDVLEGIEGISLPANLGDSVGETINKIPGLEDLLEIKEEDDTYSLVLGEEVMGLVSSLVVGTSASPGMLGGAVVDLLGESIGGSVLDAIGEFLAKEPELSIKVTMDDGVISAIGIGYEQGTDVANINIGVKLADKAVSISTPSAKDKAINLGLGVDMGTKGLHAALELYGAANLSADLNTLAYGDLTINGVKSYATFNGQQLVFNTDALFNAVEMEVPANNVFTATIQKTNEDGTVAVDDENNPITQSIVSIINNAAANFKADYIKNNDAAQAAEEAAGPSKGITHILYELIGGEATLNKNGDAYEEITEKAMMAQLESVIGDYVRFDIDDVSASNNYLNTVNAIVNILAENDTWLFGGDVINDDFADNIEGFMDYVQADGELFNFSNWLNSGVKADGGIFNWDTDTYDGGIVLTKPEADNDLLDAANLFACLGKEDGDPIDITAAAIADAANYYIAALGYYFDMYDTVAIDQIDMEYELAKMTYANHKAAGTVDEEVQTAFDTAKANHKTALKAYYTEANANIIIGELLNVEYDETNGSYLQQLIEEGVYFHLGAVKDGGINGYLEIAKDKELTKSYLKISAHFNLVDNTVVEDAEDAADALDTTDATELFAPAIVTGTDEDADDYRIILEVDGQKQVWLDEVAGEYKYNYVKDANDNFVYSMRHAALEELFASILPLLDAYLDYVPAAA